MLHGMIDVMKGPDVDKERSEKKLSLDEFKKCYNENLPAQFPQASVSFLREFQRLYPSLFKEVNVWTFAQHRKKFMDWLPNRLKEHSP
jgi:hypothetical protein